MLVQSTTMQLGYGRVQTLYKLCAARTRPPKNGRKKNATTQNGQKQPKKIIMQPPGVVFLVNLLKTIWLMLLVSLYVFFFDEAAIVLQRYKSISGSKYTL